jgi:hypothetical protein
MEAVHYRGEAPMWTDVMSGAVQAGSGSYAAASSVLQSGNGRAIAVPTKERMKKLPDVGTFYEQGVTDIAFQVQGFICLVGPAAMPKEIVLKLSDMMVEAGKTERIQKIIDTFGIDVVNSPTFATDGAQWKRMGVVDQQAIQKVYWSVDPQNTSTVASDENTGWGLSPSAADVHPLRSMHALNERLRGITAESIAGSITSRTRASST